MSEHPTGVELSGRSGKRAWIYLAAAACALSLFALVLVLGNVAAGIAPQRDENAWAHLFQISMAAQLPLLLLFLVIADWRQRRRVLLLLGIQIIAAGFAFAALAWSGY